MTLLANEGTEGMCNAGQGIYSFFFFSSHLVVTMETRGQEGTGGNSLDP